MLKMLPPPYRQREGVPEMDSVIFLLIIVHRKSADNASSCKKCAFQPD